MVTLEDKQEYAKNELGLKQAFNMKEKTLDKKISESGINPKTLKPYDVAEEENTSQQIADLINDGIPEGAPKVTPLTEEHIEGMAAEAGIETVKKKNEKTGLKLPDGDLESLAVETATELPHKETINIKDVKIVIDPNGLKYLKAVKFDFEKLATEASELRIEKAVYKNKHRAFKCYREGAFVDWIDIASIGVSKLK